ncbi:uncharacterized protein LOC120674652 [Panicum virgatum]|uniref:uncharacterized protein LOC120674652 n=1 Tax=Panicum virgatum TaxID=38727 RepID=UPI0019D51D01|nr:uncharacterized protein LOC120674652 [Panicum virgatum]
MAAPFVASLLAASLVPFQHMVDNHNAPSRASSSSFPTRLRPAVMRVLLCPVAGVCVVHLRPPSVPLSARHLFRFVCPSPAPSPPWFSFTGGTFCFCNAELTPEQKAELVMSLKGIKNFTVLIELDLLDNNITALPAEPGLLEPNLQVLKLDGNPLIRYLPRRCQPTLVKERQGVGAARRDGGPPFCCVGTSHRNARSRTPRSCHCR